LQKAYLPLRETAKKAYLASATALTRLRNAVMLEQNIAKRSGDARPSAGRFVRVF
jgi:hypothetical protein